MVFTPGESISINPESIVKLRYSTRTVSEGERVEKVHGLTNESFPLILLP